MLITRNYHYTRRYTLPSPPLPTLLDKTTTPYYNYDEPTYRCIAKFQCVHGQGNGTFFDIENHRYFYFTFNELDAYYYRFLWYRCARSKFSARMGGEGRRGGGGVKSQPVSCQLSLTTPDPSSRPQLYGWKKNEEKREEKKRGAFRAFRPGSTAHTAGV